MAPGASCRSNSRGSRSRSATVISMAGLGDDVRGEGHSCAGSLFLWLQNTIRLRPVPTTSQHAAARLQVEARPLLTAMPFVGPPCEILKKLSLRRFSRKFTMPLNVPPSLPGYSWPDLPQQVAKRTERSTWIQRRIPMNLKSTTGHRSLLKCSAGALAMLQGFASVPAPALAQGADANTATPIK